MNKIFYFKTDLKRLLKNYPVYVAILGVAMALLFSLENRVFQEGMVNGNILETYYVSISSSGQMIAYAFCSFAYATVFCEDLENKYLRYSINRGSTVRYVASKSIVIYLSSVITMVLGTVLFILFLCTELNWTSEYANVELFMSGMYSSFIADGNYIAYILMCALQMGMLAGTLSLFAAFLSMFVRNRMLISISPILVYQILLEYRGAGTVNVMIFTPYLNYFNSDIQYFFIVSVFSVFPSLFFMLGIYKKLKGRL